MKHRPSYEATVAKLPERIAVTRYALSKAFKINELVRAVHNDSYEWYGFTIGNRRDPELIVDISLPMNDQNLLDYARVSPEAIALCQESLPGDEVINGWIHSHGSLPYEQFSEVDDHNQVAALDYVTASLRKPVAKKEILIRDLTILVKDRWTEKEMQQGSVALIADAPITEAHIIETIYGGFCYAIVIGDNGWHRQEIHYRRRAILSGLTTEEKRDADIVFADGERQMTAADVQLLKEEVRLKIRPGVPVLRERFERDAT